MESRVGVAKTLFASAQGSEVFGGLWDNVVVQLEGDSTELVAVGGNVKVNLGHGFLGGCLTVAGKVRELNALYRFFFFGLGRKAMEGLNDEMGEC